MKPFGCCPLCGCQFQPADRVIEKQKLMGMYYRLLHIECFKAVLDVEVQRNLWIKYFLIDGNPVVDHPEQGVIS